jgi:hypothetical protein
MRKKVLSMVISLLKIPEMFRTPKRLELMLQLTTQMDMATILLVLHHQLIKEFLLLHWYSNLLQS